VAIRNYYCTKIQKSIIINPSNQKRFDNYLTLIGANIMTSQTTKKLTLQSLSARIDELEKEVELLKNRPVRDRGPASERQMTDEDARRILMGDLKDESHRKCAEELGLSYGQIYSARNGFTFKKVYKESQQS